MEETDLLEVLANMQSAKAAADAAAAVQKTLQERKEACPDWSKLLAEPNVEIKAYREWAWSFEKPGRMIPLTWVQLMLERKANPSNCQAVWSLGFVDEGADF